MAEAFRGMREARRKYGQLPRIVLHEAAAGTFEHAEVIMGDAKANYVPVKTGNLRESGHNQLPTFSGNRFQVRGGFGGPAADYALEVHENLEARHTVGSAEYLVRPARAHDGELLPRVDQRLDRALNKLANS